MKITDIVDKEIAVYAECKFDMEMLLHYLDKQKYKWINGRRVNEGNPYGLYAHVCIYISKSGIRWCDIGEVIEAGFDIINCNKFDDFKSWVRKIKDERQRRYEEALKNSVVEIEIGATLPLSVFGYEKIKEIPYAMTISLEGYISKYRQDVRQSKPEDLSCGVRKTQDFRQSKRK